MTAPDATTGVVFDVQPYALYDGPGIRTTVFLKGCPLRCFWCHNPESWQAPPQMGWTAARCRGDGACVRACPNGALAWRDGRMTREPAACLTCASCVAACPNFAHERLGRRMTATDVAAEALADRAFFERSGGGVTVTGGEPTRQPRFLLALLARLRAQGCHTALESCGHFPTTLVEPLAALVDLFLFDLKHIDPDAHRAATGVDNRLILNNFSAILARAGAQRVVPRIPLVPGFNTDDDTVLGLLALLADRGYRGEVHLMPHHGLARGKYERIGRGADFRAVPALSAAALARICDLVDDRGFVAVPHG